MRSPPADPCLVVDDRSSPVRILLVLDMDHLRSRLDSVHSSFRPAVNQLFLLRESEFLSWLSEPRSLLI